MRAASPFTAFSFAILLALGSLPGVGPLIVTKAIQATMPRHTQGAALKAQAIEISNAEDIQDSEIARVSR